MEVFFLDRAKSQLYISQKLASNNIFLASIEFIFALYRLIQRSCLDPVLVKFFLLNFAFLL